MFSFVKVRLSGCAHVDVCVCVNVCVWNSMCVCVYVCCMCEFHNPLVNQAYDTLMMVELTQYPLI